MADEGGTSIRNRRKVQFQEMPDQRMGGMPDPRGDPRMAMPDPRGDPRMGGPDLRGDPRMGGMPDPRGDPRMDPRSQMNYDEQPPPQRARKQEISKFKSMFGSSDENPKKMAILVVVIFLVFNSRLFWRQIARLPMMGGIEPSMVALIFNSLLAGIVFYIISKLINK